jgi:hypothetical protein
VFASVAALAVAAPAGATNECRGLNPCVPVAGPWVVVPVAQKLPRPQVQFQLDCPRGFVVGGLDAEVTDRALDVEFLGSSGAPVSPGITTSRSVVFIGWYTGTRSRAPSFRPHVGCLPGSGGGGRIQTAASAFQPPGKPVTRRIVNALVLATRRIVVRCHAGEHFVGWYATHGFSSPLPPTPAIATSLTTTVRVGTAGISSIAHARTPFATVQLGVLCAGGT